MSYNKSLSWRDYEIDFEYEFDSQGLVLVSWNTQEDIICVVESQFIERQIYKWLDEEFSKNSDNYLKDFLDYLAEKAYDKSREA